MKTFDEKDLITWSNRHNAKVGDKGYFANCINDLKDDIEHDNLRTLVDISADYNCCFDCYSSIDSETYSFSFFLPRDAVKGNKTYRACRNVKELYELIFNTKSKADDRFYIDELIGTVIHFRHKKNKIQFYEQITGIVVYDSGYFIINIYCSIYELSTLFKDYEIEINGEWKPFGVLEK